MPLFLCYIEDIHNAFCWAHWIFIVFSSPEDTSSLQCCLFETSCLSTQRRWERVQIHTATFRVLHHCLRILVYSI
jgi:hypothetical protein